MNDLLAHIPPAAIAAALSWLAYELRQWRIWWMQNHGGAPDKDRHGNDQHDY